MKRIFALLIAALVLLSSFAALAEGQVNVGDPGAPFEGDTHWDTTFTGKKDGTLSVGGLLPGDTVKFYRVLAFDADASTKVSELTTSSDVTKGAGGWKVIAPFDTVISGTDLKDILSVGINDELAGKIAKKAVDVKDDTATTEVDETYNAKYTAKVKEEEGETVATVGSTEDPVEDGLYVAIVIPAEAGWMFNPIFVSSDYYSSKDADQSSTWTALTGQSYRNKAMAKKAPIEITKEASEKNPSDNEKVTQVGENMVDDAKSAGVGDVIDFNVKTTIPEFADNYTAPLFVVTDKLTAGLTLDQTSIKVYKASVSEGEWTKGEQIEEVKANFEITNKSDTGYKITFNSTYLLNLSAAQPIMIEYSATVTEDAVTNVNEEENTVTLEYSHEPSVDQEGEGKKIRDKTHHYTYTIDGNIWGKSGWETTEVVKIGLDKDGNELKETRPLHQEQEIGALKDAEFCLYTDAECTKEYNKGAYAEVDNTGHVGKIISDEDGRLSLIGAEEEGIPGLDAGTYWLKEVKAPDGYIKYQNAVKIEIIPTYYDEFSFTETEDGVDYTITCDDVLKSYKVKIDDAQTAEYVLHYEYLDNKTEENDDRIPKNDVAIEDGENMMTTAGDIVIGNYGPYEDRGTEERADDGKIPNTQGVELPSTGGIGTTIFYIGGSILVLAAVILLVTKRRMGSEE